jgi:hypothetical protein
MSRADLPPSILWRNRQNEARLVLRHKPRNRHGDFETQIIKPELPVLRPQPGNPPPPWFWVSTNKLTTNFEAKPGETVAISFEAKLEKTVATGFEAKLPETVAAGFEAKPLESVTTGFEAKPVKTVRVILRSNHSQKIKEKQNETIPDSNSNLTKSMTHHNQTKKLTTWFLTFNLFLLVLMQILPQMSKLNANLN